MRINAAPRILIVAGLCVAALIGLVVREGQARASGVEALLPIEAVDPRALLSGNYVTLSPTQRLDESEHCPPSEETQRWVALTPEGDIYRVTGAAASREQAQLLGGMAVRGSFTCNEPIPATADTPALPGAVRVDVGISRFHVNQAEAQRIERVLREQRVGEETRAFAIVSLGRDGRARLKGLMIDRERLELRWL